MKNKIALLTLILIVSTSACISNPFQKEFDGVKYTFRSDLNEANKISVYPSENTLSDFLLRTDYSIVKFVFVSNESLNGYYATDFGELTLGFKVLRDHKNYFFNVENITTIMLNSSEEISGVLDENPTILLIADSNQTAVNVDIFNNLITIEGRDMRQLEINRKYTDLDLATDKLLLTLME